MKMFNNKMIMQSRICHLYQKHFFSVMLGGSNYVSSPIMRDIVRFSFHQCLVLIYAPYSD